MTYLIPQTPAAAGGATLQGSWKFDTAITATDPGNKKFKFNALILANVTEIFISETTNNNNDASNILALLVAGNRIYAQQSDDSSRAVLFEVSGAPVDNGSWYTIPVTVVGSFTLMGNNKACGVILDLSGAGGASPGSIITTITPQDLAGQASAGSGIPTGTKGFHMDIWDLNMDNNAERPALRFYDPTIHTTGYAYQRWDKSNSAAYAQTVGFNAAADTWFDPIGINNTAINWGYWEGRLMDPATNLWVVYGKFRDNAATDLTHLEVFGQVTLDAEATVVSVQSGNASTWAAGMLGMQSWT